MQKIKSVIVLGALVVTACASNFIYNNKSSTSNSQNAMIGVPFIDSSLKNSLEKLPSPTELVKELNSRSVGATDAFYGSLMGKLVAYVTFKEGNTFVSYPYIVRGDTYLSDAITVSKVNYSTDCVGGNLSLPRCVNPLVYNEYIQFVYNTTAVKLIHEVEVKHSFDSVEKYTAFKKSNSI